MQICCDNPCFPRKNRIDNECTTDLQVAPPAGSRRRDQTVSDGTVTVYGPVLSTKVGPGTAGTYNVLWRTVSSDGHPIEGKHSFTVQASAPTTDPVSPTATALSAAQQPTAAATSAAPEPVKPPDNDNAPLVLGTAAAIVADAIGGGLFLRNRRKNTKS